MSDLSFWKSYRLAASGLILAKSCRSFEEVVKKFGEEAREVAIRHIISDLKMEGWTEKDPFPKDEADYKRMSFF